MVNGKYLSFEKEIAKDGEIIIKVNSKYVDVFGRGSKGEKIFLEDKNGFSYNGRFTMHLHSYNIGDGWAKYHTSINLKYWLEGLKLKKW